MPAARWTPPVRSALHLHRSSPRPSVIPSTSPCWFAPRRSASPSAAAQPQIPPLLSRAAAVLPPLAEIRPCVLPPEKSVAAAFFQLLRSHSDVQISIPGGSLGRRRRHFLSSFIGHVGRTRRRCRH